MRPAKTFTLEEAKTMATEAMGSVNKLLEGTGYSFSMGSIPGHGILYIYLNCPNGERFMFDDIMFDGDDTATYMAAYATLATEEEHIKEKGEKYIQEAVLSFYQIRLEAHKSYYHE